MAMGFGYLFGGVFMRLWGVTPDVRLNPIYFPYNRLLAMETQPELCCSQPLKRHQSGFQECAQVLLLPQTYWTLADALRLGARLLLAYENPPQTIDFDWCAVFKRI